MKKGEIQGQIHGDLENFAEKGKNRTAAGDCGNNIPLRIVLRWERTKKTAKFRGKIICLFIQKLLYLNEKRGYLEFLLDYFYEGFFFEKFPKVHKK